MIRMEDEGLVDNHPCSLPRLPERLLAGRPASLPLPKLALTFSIAISWRDPSGVGIAVSPRSLCYETASSSTCDPGSSPAPATGISYSDASEETRGFQLFAPSPLGASPASRRRQGASLPHQTPPQPEGLRTGTTPKGAGKRSNGRPEDESSTA